MMIQAGARRNYIYARQLEQAGLLHSLVTDLAWPQQKALPLLPRLLRRSQRFSGAIARRTVMGIPAEKVMSSALPHIMRSALGWRHAEDGLGLAYEAIAARCKRRGLDGVQVIVSYLDNGGSFLDYAKLRGVRIVTDFICMPNVLEIEEAERQHWPAWGGEPIPQRVIDQFRARMRHLLSISDIYLCPSLSVANGLSQLPEYEPSRMRLVPYGSGGYSPLGPLSEKGRVLFVGAALPRKGLPYLGLAAKILKDQGFPVKVVVAGKVTQEVRKQPETQCLEFLGVQSREAIRSEFARADVFCLPSLTEGSSSAIFEALASGIPVVTTASSGSVIQHGVEGLVVPERDPGAIAAAIRTIIEDREMRERMSNAARNSLDCYSDETVGSIFIRTIKELQETQG